MDTFLSELCALSIDVIQQAVPLAVLRSGCRLGLQANTVVTPCSQLLCAGLRSSVTHGICIPAEASAASPTFLNSLLIFIVV